MEEKIEKMTKDDTEVPVKTDNSGYGNNNQTYKGIIDKVLEESEIVEGIEALRERLKMLCMVCTDCEDMVRIKKARKQRKKLMVIINYMLPYTISAGILVSFLILCLFLWSIFR